MYIDSWILLLFIINNLIWMLFFSVFVYNLLPQKVKESFKIPRVRIKNPLAKEKKEPELEEISESNSKNIMDSMMKQYARK